MNENTKIEDLIRDQSFLNWMQETNEGDVNRWNDWCKDRPDRYELMLEAKAVVQGLIFTDIDPTHADTNASWSRLKSKIDTSSERPQARAKRGRRWFVLVLLLCMLSILTYFSIKHAQRDIDPEPISYHTGLEESKTFLLPDGSSATLNTNSSISFPSNYLEQQERVITLAGEAYFNIKTQPQGVHVVVQSEDYDIKVLGTEFNINAKRTIPIISLIEGSIQLSTEQGQVYDLQEGQTATYNLSTMDFDISDNQSDYWKSWTKRIWSFGNGTPMSEVLTRIEETFSVSCEVKDALILEKSASGDVSVESKEVLFEALGELLDVEFSINKGEVTISALE